MGKMLSVFPLTLIKDLSESSRELSCFLTPIQGHLECRDRTLRRCLFQVTQQGCKFPGEVSDESGNEANARKEVKRGVAWQTRDLVSLKEEEDSFIWLSNEC
jgi:hypothetical protein